LLETKVLVERWKVKYNTVRPHSSLNYRPPAPEAIKPEWLENAVALSEELVQLIGAGQDDTSKTK
jgi:putative transposase